MGSFWQCNSKILAMDNPVIFKNPCVPILWQTDMINIFHCHVRLAEVTSDTSNRGVIVKWWSHRPLCCLEHCMVRRQFGKKHTDKCTNTCLSINLVCLEHLHAFTPCAATRTQWHLVWKVNLTPNQPSSEPWSRHVANWVSSVRRCVIHEGDGNIVDGAEGWHVVAVCNSLVNGSRSYGSISETGNWQLGVSFRTMQLKFDTPNLTNMKSIISIQPQSESTFRIFPGMGWF